MMGLPIKKVKPMYSVPQEFDDRLQSEFDGRLRVRWSYTEGAFHIEQKIARGLANAFPAPANNDALIRLRDGYIYVMSVRNGDRMPCPHCGLTLKVPVYEVAMISCEHCRLKGYNHHYPAGFFELNDRLIEYLRSLDPLKGAARRNRDRVDRMNAKVQASQDRYSDNLLEDAVSDQFTKIAGIQSVGYTGKEF